MTLSVSDTYAIQLFARYVDLPPRRQLSEVICIDEVHVNISKVCNYALVLQDFLTGEPIDMVVNRRQEITEPYFSSIPKAERFRVKYLISDMYRPYISYVDKYFPNAISIVDSFYVVKMINEKILGYIRRLQNKYKHLDEQRHERLEQQLGRKIVNSFIMLERMCADGVHISRLSNGPMEALNRIAKDMKRKGHGYRNFNHLRNRFLFSQRKNAQILATPLPLEVACPETGIKRGRYHKQD